MSKVNNGGPAFPRDTKCRVDGSIIQRGSSGMTLMEYYMGEAMKGLLSQPLDQGLNYSPDSVAELSCQYADALIARLGGQDE